MFADKLKKLRKQNKLTQEQFAEKMNISKGAVGMWETGKRTPDKDMLIKISEFFHMPVDELIKPSSGYYYYYYYDDSELRPTEEELSYIKKYRALDEHGKKVIDYMLDEEYARCSVEVEEECPTITIRHSTYKVSAGRGFDLEDRDSWEEIDIPDTPEARKADFAITIIGNSMEPIYSDGQIVLVHEQPAVDIGETGIYIINGGGFIKRNGGDRLISINPDYDDIYFSEGDTVYCAGKVIGTV